MPPLPFRRRPPQSNCLPDIVPRPDYDRRLGFQNTKGGISRLPPRTPECTDQKLPPILRNVFRKPMPSYSEGSRGLFVLPRVARIFTRTPISLGLQLRQWGSRYAIRAGRNLPD